MVQTSKSHQLGGKPGKKNPEKLQYSVIGVMIKELHALTYIEEALKTALQCQRGLPGRNDI